MREFEGRVAVVTGAASGIGLGMARSFTRLGMKVALADVEEDALAEAERGLVDAGKSVMAVVTDVSQRTSVEALAEAVAEHFGAVHVLCNNAGVSGGGGPLWETTARDWNWVLGVNLMGVVHGVQTFVPGMLAHGEAGHIVNTSSVLGLSTGAGGIYGVTKHAVTRLSEGLYYDLRSADAKLGVSVLCPGMIATRILRSERNRPADLRNLDASPRPDFAARRDAMEKLFLERGMPPDEVGEIVVDAIEHERFYVLTHREVKQRVEVRMKDILEERNPSPLPRPGMS